MSLLWSCDAKDLIIEPHSVISDRDSLEIHLQDYNTEPAFDLNRTRVGISTDDSIVMDIGGGIEAIVEVDKDISSDISGKEIYTRKPVIGPNKISVFGVASNKIFFEKSGYFYGDSEKKVYGLALDKESENFKTAENEKIPTEKDAIYVGLSDRVDFDRENFTYTSRIFESANSYDYSYFGALLKPNPGKGLLFMDLFPCLSRFRVHVETYREYSEDCELYYTGPHGSGVIVPPYQYNFKNIKDLHTTISTNGREVPVATTFKTRVENKRYRINNKWKTRDILYVDTISKTMGIYPEQEDIVSDAKELTQFNEYTFRGRSYHSKNYHYVVDGTELKDFSLKFDKGLVYGRNIGGKLVDRIYSKPFPMKVGHSYTVVLYLNYQYTYLFSDGTTGFISQNKGKKPIGIVVDPDKRIAAALKDIEVKELWSTISPTEADVVFGQETVSESDDGYTNTYGTISVGGESVIRATDKRYPAFVAVASYKPESTLAPNIGRWYIPSHKEMEKMIETITLGKTVLWYDAQKWAFRKSIGAMPLDDDQLITDDNILYDNSYLTSTVDASNRIPTYAFHFVTKEKESLHWKMEKGYYHAGHKCYVRPFVHY